MDDTSANTSVPLSSTLPPYYAGLHVKYITTLAKKLDSPTSYEGAMTEHLRMSGIYWSLCALSLLRTSDEVDQLMNVTGRFAEGYKELSQSEVAALATESDKPVPVTSEANQSYEMGQHERKDGDPEFCTRNKKRNESETDINFQAATKQQHEEIKKRQSIVDWVFACYDPKCGGFGGNIHHDAHILYTLSALQILALANKLDDERLNKIKVAQYITSLQQANGSFSGDCWGEIDTRFSYCAICSLSLLGMLPSPDYDDDNNIDVNEKSGENVKDELDIDDNSENRFVIDLSNAVKYISSCRNFDGGYGCIPGAESHAGQIFCCVGALSIAGAVHLIDTDLLCWWLAERQCDSGGLNGRPEKQADVCYSWWILSALSIMGRVSWINSAKLSNFILNCQDDEDGGIADRPANMADVFHTFFGISGLSLLGYLTKGLVKRIGSHLENGPEGVGWMTQEESRTYREIDPLYALPTDVVERLNLRGQIICPKGKVDEPGDERLKRYVTLKNNSLALRF